MAGYRVTRLDEIGEMDDGRVPFRPVRHHFGIESFGVNTWTAQAVGERIVNEHDEVSADAGDGQEELYFVHAGRARFELDGESVDAPAGTFVFVRDPAAKRTAIASEVGTTILVAGGKPGEAFSPSPWEHNAQGLVHFANEDYDKAAETYEQFLTEQPGDAGFLYNLACAESLLGRKDSALKHLRESVEAEERFKESAVGDPDFDAIRDDPEFLAITGQTDTGGAGS
jgi:tetratricopeptide (TPR) repeat protein